MDLVFLTTFALLFAGFLLIFHIGVEFSEKAVLTLALLVRTRLLPSQNMKIQHRFEMLEETLQIAKQMWSGKRDPYNGRHNQLSEPINNPQPLSKPHPKILIGGMGEKKTLRLVAQYADACNLFTYSGLEVINHKLKVLKKHCETIGRPYDEIERTALGTVNLSSGNMSTDDAIGMCKGLANESIEHVILNMPNVHEITPLEKFGEEIIPAVADF